VTHKTLDTGVATDSFSMKEVAFNARLKRGELRAQFLEGVVL
jgi:hypothetical protein